MGQKDLEIQEEKNQLKEIQKKFNLLEPTARKNYLKQLKAEMTECAKNLEFEKAAMLRDEIEKCKTEWNMTK